MPLGWAGAEITRKDYFYLIKHNTFWHGCIFGACGDLHPSLVNVLLVPIFSDTPFEIDGLLDVSEAGK